MDEKTTNEVSIWHENFDDRIYKNVDETDTEAMTEAKELSESTYELDGIYMKEILHIRQEHKQMLQEHKQMLQEQKRVLQEQDERIQLLEEDIARAKRRSAQRFTYMKDLNILRGYLNMKFRRFWLQLSQKEEKIDDMVTPEMLNKYSNRINIYDDLGYKFAVYVLENSHSNVLGASCETCKFYILLNEKMHPPISPHIIVEKAIQEIKRHDDPDLQQEYHITDEVLDEIVNFK